MKGSKSKVILLLFIVVALIAEIFAASESSSTWTVHQKYFALMNKKQQLDDLSRNSMLMAMSSDENWDALKSSITKQYETLKNDLQQSGSESFKSCADINNQRLNIFGKSKLDDGVYIIFVEKQAIPVYCDMTSLGGGFTLVRRVSTQQNWWPLDDNFSGVGYGIYDPNLSFAPNVVFGLNYKSIPRTSVLFKTGDSMHWLVVNENLLQEFTEKDECTRATPIIASSKYPTVKSSNWCVRKVRPEDPWVSIEDHASFGRSVFMDDEMHSMLWGENNSNGWGYWKNNHNGVNVFIR